MSADFTDHGEAQQIVEQPAADDETAAQWGRIADAEIAYERDHSRPPNIDDRPVRYTAVPRRENP